MSETIMENEGLKQQDIDNEQDEAIRKPFIAREKTELEWRVYDTTQRLIKYYEDYVYPEWYSIIKQNEKFSGDMYVINSLMGHPNRSCSVYPLISSVHDTYKANLYDTETKSKAVPRREDWREKAEEAQNFMDWAQSVSDVDVQKILIRDEATLIWTSYGIASMVEEEMFDMSILWMENDTDASYLPYWEHLSAFQVYVEPSTKNFYRARYKTVRKIMALDDCEGTYSWGIDFNNKYNSEAEVSVREEILWNNDFVSDKDYTKIYMIKQYETKYVESCLANNTAEDIATFFWGDFMEDNLIQVDFSTNKLVEVIEYWEDNKLVIMINGRVYYDGKNPYRMCPIGVVKYEEKPWTHFGIGIGQKLMSHQRQVNTIRNWVNDAIQMHIRPMYAAVEWTLKGADWLPIQTLEYQDGLVVYSDYSNASNWGFEPIRFIDTEAISIGIRHIRDLLAESQEIIGTNSYTQWGQGKVERSFGAVNARLWVTRSRLQPIIKSLNKFDERMFHTWLVASSVLMKDWVSVRILWEDGDEIWKTIKTSELINKYNIVVENEAVRQATKMERARIMIESLQTLMPHLYDQSTGMPIADVRGIIKYALEQNNFLWEDIFDKDKIQEYVKDQTELAMFLEEAKQKVSWQETQPPADPLAWLWAALDAPLQGIEQGLGGLEGGLTRGSFPE